MSILRRLFAASPVTETSNVGWTGATFWPIRSSSGVTVTGETALGLDTYFACLRVIAEDCTKAKRRVMQMDGENKKEALDHPAHRLLNVSANPNLSPSVCFQTLFQWAAGWGNGYAEITRDGTGNPTGIFPIHPSRVTLKRVDGDRYYLVLNDGGATVRIDDTNMFHLRGMGDADQGYSLIQFAAQTIGLALASERYGATFFGNNAMPSVVLKYPGALSEVAQNKLRESWIQKYSGNNAHKPALLEEGLDLQVLSIPNDQAQFIETQRFSVEKMCRWCRVSPVKVGYYDKQPTGTMEQLNIDHVNDTLLPWWIRFEEEANLKLCGIDSPYFVKHNARALLRGDLQSQAQFLREMFFMGTYTHNKVLEYLDEDPFDGGDVRYMPSNMATQDAINNQELGRAQSGQPGNDTAPVAPGNGNGQRRDSKAAIDTFVPVLASALMPSLRKESKAIAAATAKHTGEAFTDWAIRFYITGQSQQMVEAVIAPARALVAIITNDELDAEQIESVARTSCKLFIDTYIDDARAAIVCDGTREAYTQNVEKSAESLAQTLANQLAVSAIFHIESRPVAA